jgi:DMSO/TMAO reductase YedYZ molybdopterin-dependent catalytic subunit
MLGKLTARESSLMSNHSRLPPNQSLTHKFPAVGEREPEPFSLDQWRLTLDGMVRQPLSLSLAAFQQLPVVERVWDTSCVTGWTHVGHRWRGVLLSDLLDSIGVQPEARFVRFEAYSRRAHDTTLPLDYARAHVLLAREVDSKPLEPVHGYPVRSVAEGKYFYKSVKWLKRIELLAVDRLGYWERTSAYHNGADPWLEDRYDPQPMTENEFERRAATRDFRAAYAIMDEKFRRLRGVDLSGAHFQDAAIKACDLSGVDLRGADCSGANFTRTKFTDADLRSANLSGCDFEGADLRGADLRGADLRGAMLTVARFAHRHRPARIARATFRRGDIENEGLADTERLFLLDPIQAATVES